MEILSYWVRGNINLDRDRGDIYQITKSGYIDMRDFTISPISNITLDAACNKSLSSLAGV